MPRFFYTVFSCILMIACDNQERNRADSFSTDDSTLHAFLDEYYKTMSNRDWRKYRECFWENATIIASWQKEGDSAVNVHVTTIDDFIEATPAGPDSKPIFSEKMRSASVDIKGNLASAWVDYDVEFGTRDSLMKWSGTDVFTFLKNNGEWRIASLVFESN